MLLEDIEKNKEKVNKAALSVIEEGAPNSSDELTVDENVEVDTKNIEGETSDDGKFKIDLGDALSTKLENITGSLSTFTETVGKTFENIATEVPKKIEEIYSDKDKKRNFLRGLYIINASSGITPIGQAKSPLGKISEGLLTAEKQFTAEDLKAAEIEAQKLKALNTKRGVLEPHEAALLKNYTKYTEKEDLNRKNYAATFDIYNLLKKATFEKKELPTGVLAKVFQGAEAAITEIPGGAELLDVVLKRGGDTEWMNSKQQVTFKNILGAATKQKIVSQVKELYPVSNKDIEILLQTVGDIGTNPEALRRLVAAQMATREISLNQRKYASQMFKKNDLDFKENSFYAAEKELADSFRDSVDDETLLAMYGTIEDISDSGIIAAKYYQDLQYKFDDDQDPFDIFKQSKIKSTEETLELIKDRQLKNNNKKIN
tara:strand:+ start:169 stop:1461 length:1293 start_codon:yes stop_codon:yes gene_type:complete